MQAKQLTPAGVALTSTAGKLVAMLATPADWALTKEIQVTSQLCTQALIDSSTLPDGSLDPDAKYVEVDGLLCTVEEAKALGINVCPLGEAQTMLEAAAAEAARRLAAADKTD